MADTQPSPVALPPPSFLGTSFGNGPYLPPPSQLTAPYFPPAPVPRSDFHRSQYSPPARIALPHPGHPSSSSSSSTATHYQPPPSQRNRPYAANEYLPPFSPPPSLRPQLGPTSAEKEAERAGQRLVQRGDPPLAQERRQPQLRPRPLDNFSPTHGPVAAYRDPIPSTIPAAFTASVSSASSERPHFKVSTHEIKVRQQPIAARACGFGDKDRRVIDPPPIVQLFVKETTAPKTEQDDIRYPFNVVHCSLWNEEGRCDVTEIPGHDGHNTRRLMGTLVASPFYGKDEHDREGCFFSFPDLSCRTNGRYRLRFVLMRLEPNNLRPGQFMPTVTETESEVFTVFTAKEFPGMRASTALTKSLKKQGCAISVKKGNEKSNSYAQEESSIGDESDGSPGSAGKSKRRRQR
ncbi:MAG: hypothetical protein M1814_002469 [Vezdaea aestivalis]|nr:MAG: hypothetical protein M1814_002469 [Vezdaea aestivalis]